MKSKKKKNLKKEEKRKPQFKTVKEPAELKNSDLFNLKKKKNLMNKLKQRNLFVKEKEVLL